MVKFSMEPPMPIKNFYISREKNKYSKFSFSWSWSAEDLMNLFTDEKIMPNSKEGFHKQLLCMLSMIRWEKQTKKRRISAAFSLSYSQNAEDRMNLFTDENVMPSTLLKIKEGFAVMPQNNHLWFPKEQFLK